MDNVAFTSIPDSIRVPGVYIEIDPSLAVSGLPGQQRRLVIWGQRLATGTVAAGIPTRLTRAADAQVYFGRGSMLARMAAAVFGTDAKYADVWAIALDDLAGGVAATKTITIASTGTAAGTLALYIGGVRVAIAVAAAQPAATTATALAAAITAAADLPVTATASVSVVTLTSRHKGECGQDLDVRHSYFTGEALPAGMTLTVANATAGSGNPDVTAALAAMTWKGATWVINPWTDATNLAIVEAEQTTRWGPLAQTPLWTFSSVSNTFANLSTYGSARNGAFSATLGVNGSPTWAPERAAAWGATCAVALTLDPARPLQTLTVPGILAPLESSRFTWSESNLLAYDGISVLDWAPDGTAVILTALSNYQTTPAGVESAAYLKINTSVTVHEIRYQVRQRIATKFPRAMLVDDGVPIPPGRNTVIVSPRIIKGELIALGQDLVEASLVERMGAADIDVLRSTSAPNRVNAVLRPNIVNQFDVFAAKVQFIL